MLRVGDESTVIREDEDPIPAHEVKNEGFPLDCGHQYSRRLGGYP